MTTEQTNIPIPAKKNGMATHGREILELPIAIVHEAKSNYRKTFDSKEDAELTKSVKAHGVIQPLLVRPVKGEYEIVFGARRRRAADAAELGTIPCEVRALTDLQALELRLVENVQRSDVHPLEEAEAFEKLHKEHKRSIEEIAAMISKSVGHVYQRIKLLALTKELREVFREETITPYHALLISRVPASLQSSALKKIAPEVQEWDETTRKHVKSRTLMSARDAAAMIQKHFMLRLDQAPFDRKLPTLVAAAGACTVCPKRTGNQSELFADVKSPDLCTDSECFESKVEAHNKIALKEYAAKGAQVVETKKIWRTESDYISWNGPFVLLDEAIWTGNKNEVPRKVLGKIELSQMVVAIDRDGRLRELVRRKLFEDALPKRRDPTGAATSKTEKARMKEQRKRIAVKKELTDRVLVELVAKAKEKDPASREFWFFLAQAFDDGAGFEARVSAANHRGLGKKGQGHEQASKLRGWILKAKTDELRALVVELAASIGSFYGETLGKNVKAGAAVFKINVGKLTTAIKSEKKAKKAKKPASKKPVKK